MGFRRWLLLILMLVPSVARAQNGLVSVPTTLMPGPRLGSNLTISFCTSTATGVPCSPFAQAYADSTNSNPINQTTSPLRTDNLGNAVTFYAAPGQYSYTITGPGLASPQGPYQITVPCIPGGTCASTAANNAFTGNNSFSGQNIITAYNINNKVIVDGQKYTTLNAALADPACTSLAGCTIDMTGNNATAALALGAFDPGSKKVTVLLGPFGYNASQITMENYLHIIGAARGATTLQSTSTTTPLFVLGGSSAVYSNHIENVVVYCGAGNTSQVAFDIVAQVNGGGLNYSDWNNVTVGGDGVHECGGGSWLFNGAAGGSPPAINQFINITNSQGFRTPNGAPAFHVQGVGGQMYIANSQFDGNATRDTSPNIVIEDSAYSGFTAAYSIAFYEVTSQRAAELDRSSGSLRCHNCHFENVSGILDAAIGQNYGNFGIQILHSYCATSCGVNSGSGFLTKTDSSSQVAVDYLSVSGTPDNYWTGSSIAHLEYQGLYNFFGGSTYPAPNSSFRIPVGIASDSPGYKLAAQAFTGVAAGAYAEVDVTWATPFVDGSYVPICNVYDYTTATNAAGLRFDRLAGSSSSLSASGIKTVVFNASGGTLNGVLLCSATHQ